MSWNKIQIAYTLHIKDFKPKWKTNAEKGFMELEEWFHKEFPSFIKFPEQFIEKKLYDSAHY